MILFSIILVLVGVITFLWGMVVGQNQVHSAAEYVSDFENRIYRLEIDVINLKLKMKKKNE